MGNVVRGERERKGGEGGGRVSEHKKILTAGRFTRQSPKGHMLDGTRKVRKSMEGTV